MMWHPMGVPSPVWRAKPCGRPCRFASLLHQLRKHIMSLLRSNGLQPCPPQQTRHMVLGGRFVTTIWQAAAAGFVSKASDVTQRTLLLSFCTIPWLSGGGEVHWVSCCDAGRRAGGAGAAVSHVCSRGAAAASGAAADAPRTAAGGQWHIASRHGEESCSAACQIV